MTPLFYILPALALSAVIHGTVRAVRLRRSRAALARWRASMAAAEPVRWSQPVSDAPPPALGFAQCLDCGAVTTGEPQCDRCKERE